MFFTKIFALAALALAPIVSAQSTPLQFTTVPGPFTIGKPATLEWTGGDGSSVTLTLRQGTNTQNLETIGIIAKNIKGNSYTWTPSSSLTPGDDYALQITQGLEGNNYSGQFSIQSASSGAATTIFAVAGSSTVAVATITPNMTSTVTMQAGNATGTGTGASMPRNTTMVSPTLSTTATLTSTVSTTGTASSTSTTGGAIAQASAKAFLGLGAVAAAAVYLL